MMVKCLGLLNSYVLFSILVLFEINKTYWMIMSQVNKAYKRYTGLLNSNTGYIILCLFGTVLKILLLLKNLTWRYQKDIYDY